MSRQDQLLIRYCVLLSEIFRVHLFQVAVLWPFTSFFLSQLNSQGNLSFQLSISFFGCVVLWLLIWKLLGLCFQVPIGVILFSFLYSKGELSSVPLRRGVPCSFHVLLFVLDEEQ